MHLIISMIRIRQLLIELVTYLCSKLNAGKRGLQVSSYKL